MSDASLANTAEFLLDVFFGDLIPQDVADEIRRQVAEAETEP